MIPWTLIVRFVIKDNGQVNNEYSSKGMTVTMTMAMTTTMTMITTITTNMAMTTTTTRVFLGPGLPTR